MLGRNGAAALGSFALALSLSIGAASAQAAACKGLDAGACNRDDRCSWVDGYVRKDGVKVASHCKSRARKSSKSAGDEAPKAKKDTKTKTQSESRY
jgi:hypothetical protein